MYFPPTEILKIANFPTLGPKGPQKPPKFTYNPKCWQHKSNKICTFPQQKSSKLQSFMSSHFHFHNDRKLSSERSGLPPVWIWNKHPHPLIYVGGIYIFFPKVGSIYPIKTFIPQMMASYIQYFWQFLTILDNFGNFAKLDFDEFFKIIFALKVATLRANIFDNFFKILTILQSCILMSFSK